MRKGLMALGFALATGCATQGGQVGSNASYQYTSRSADGTECTITVYTGRESVVGATLTIDDKCVLTAGFEQVESGETNQAILGVIESVLKEAINPVPTP